MKEQTKKFHLLRRDSPTNDANHIKHASNGGEQ